MTPGRYYSCYECDAYTSADGTDDHCAACRAAGAADHEGEPVIVREVMDDHDVQSDYYHFGFRMVVIPEHVIMS